jgi:hypothetical protein
MPKPRLTATARTALGRLWARADARHPRVARGGLFVLATAAMWMLFGGGWLGLLVDAALVVLAVVYWTRVSRLWANMGQPDTDAEAATDMLVGLDESSERLYAEAPGRL